MLSTQKHLNLKESINLGSFYTPKDIVEIAYNMLLNFVSSIEQYILLDSSCGYGNFLDIQGFKEKIGIDIDIKAINKARQRFSHCTTPPIFLHKNALLNVSRKNFNILQNSKLIIIGNPPYNDKTSIVQNNLKSKDSDEVDLELRTRDIGISFLRSYNVLQADYICVLHPLSYLIKENNFKSLKDFSSNYKLIDSVIISSERFCPKSLSFFPIIIALYKRDKQGMDYGFIKNYNFKTFEGKNFRLNNFDFIANYIDKYPNKKRVSKYVAMFYTMRDINALRRSKTFITKDCANAIYVAKEKYSLYCYVDIFKHMIPYIPYYFGNCDVVIDYKQFLLLEGDFISASETKQLTPNIEKYFKILLGEYYDD